MNRYFSLGALFFAMVFGIFLMIPSPSPVKEVEDVKQLIDTKEEISLHKASTSVEIEYESESDLSSHTHTHTHKDKQKSKINDIEKLTKEENLKPLYKEWKQKGDLSYNVYIKKSSKSEESSQKLVPPTIPSFTTVEVSGEKINVVVPSGTKGYIVTKEGDELNYQPIESSTPPIALPGVEN